MGWAALLGMTLALPGLMLVMLGALGGAMIMLPFGALRAWLVMGVGVEWCRKYLAAMITAMLGER